MNDNKKKLERVWNLLQTIPVNGALVDTMHEIRLLVADVHSHLEEVKDDGVHE